MKLSMKAQSVSGQKTRCSFTPPPARYEPAAAANRLVGVSLAGRELNFIYRVVR